ERQVDQRATECARELEPVGRAQRERDVGRSGNEIQDEVLIGREGVQARPHLDRWADRTGKMLADEPVDHSRVAEVGFERSGLRGYLGTAAVDRDLRTGLAERRQTVHVRSLCQIQTGNLAGSNDGAAAASK